jgi:SAM-dependent methyltransferase
LNRTEFIRKNFLEIELSKQTLDVYVPRQALLKAIKECMPQFQGRVLDVGCGQMPYREMMLQANQNITSYLGLDLRSSSVHDTSIADLHWDGNNIPLDENSIDTALATEVLEHSFSPTKTLLEINRVLKPGGLFFFTVPFIWPLHETPHDAYRYTPFSLKLHLEEAAFTNTNIRSLGGWHTSFAQMIGLWLKEGGLSRWERKIAVRVAKRLIPYLLRKDVKDNRFGHHSMVSGLYGTAIKNKL